MHRFATLETELEPMLEPILELILKPLLNSELESKLKPTLEPILSSFLESALQSVLKSNPESCDDPPLMVQNCQVGPNGFLKSVEYGPRNECMTNADFIQMGDFGDESR